MTKMMFLLSLLLAQLGCTSVHGFTFLANIKLPMMKSFEAQQEEELQVERFGDKKLCIITGTSSGLGKETAKALLKTGKWHVVGACRDLDKMKVVAEEEGFSQTDFTCLKLDLNSFKSVREFAKSVNEMKIGKPLDRLVCNAAVYQPLKDVKWSEDGHEQQLQTNFLSHFLLTSLLLPELKKAEKPRVIMVGSVTGNDNTVGGGGVYPIADLRTLDGLKAGAKAPIAMIDGYAFNGAKAYKDTKLALMMTSNILHDKYHRATGISFSSIYPGCIAASPLFREKRPWFRKFFPVFMKYITGGFVGEEEAGGRLFQVITDPKASKSGVYWSWNGGPREGRGLEALKNDGNIIGAGGAGGDWSSIYENDQSDKVKDVEKATLLWQYATLVTGAEWIPIKSPVSPCPTLRVIRFITNILDKREESSRPQTMKELIEERQRETLQKQLEREREQYPLAPAALA